MWPALLSLCLPPNLATFAQSRALTRPSLSGPTDTFETADGRFRLHWTDYGADAIDPSDADDDGLPDRLAPALAGLELGEAVFEARGYRPIAADKLWGGSDAIDVYLRAIDANGYAYPTLPDDSDQVSSCYIELDSSLAGVVLESVAIHELHHCVQFNYTVDADAWVYESFATFEQYLHVEGEELELLAQFLWGVRLAEPDRPMASTGDRFEYAGMIFPKFLLERGGEDLGRMHRAWLALEQEPDWEVAYDHLAFNEWGGSLDGVTLDHFTWNAFACARDDGQHYLEDNVGCTLHVEVPITPLSEGEPFTLEHRQRSHSAAYFEVENDGDARPIELICDGPGEDAEAGVRLVAVDRDGVSGEEAAGFARGRDPLDARLLGELDPQGSTLLVFSSTGEEPAGQTCAVERVEPSPEDPGGACQTAPAGAQAWLALLALLGLRRRQA